MPDTVDDDEGARGPGLGHPEHLNTEIGQQVRHQAVVPKQPLDRQRGHHWRDDKGQQRCRNNGTFELLRHAIDTQSQQKTNAQHKRQGDKSVDQCEAQRAQKFVTSPVAGRLRFTGGGAAIGIRRCSLAGDWRVVEPQHLSVVAQAHKAAVLDGFARAVKLGALREGLLLAKRRGLFNRHHFHFQRAVAHRQVKRGEQRRGQQQQHECHRGACELQK